MKWAVLITLVMVAWAKTPNVADFPLTAHIISTEDVSGRQLNAVSNLSTGEITGSSWSGSNYVRVEIQIDGHTYITHGHRTPMTDLPARIKKDTIELLSADKKGKPQIWHFYIRGERR